MDDRVANGRRSRSASRSKSRSRSRSNDRRRSRSRSKSNSRSRSRSRDRRSRSGTPRDAEGRRIISGRIHVSDISSSVDRRDLEKAFEKYGRVVDVWMASYPPIYAFITFKHGEDAERAIRKMNNESINGTRVRVAHALPKRAPMRRYGGYPRGGGRDYGGSYGGRSYNNRRTYSRSPIRRRSRSRSPVRRRDRSRSRSFDRRSRSRSVSR